MSLSYFLVQLNLLQREELRARFPGVPGDLVNFFLYVAEEVSPVCHLFSFLSCLFFPLILIESIFLLSFIV